MKRTRWPYDGLALLGLFIGLHSAGGYFGHWKLFETGYAFWFWLSVVGIWLMPPKVRGFYLALAALAVGGLGFYYRNFDSFWAQTLSVGLFVAMVLLVVASILMLRESFCRPG